MQEGIFLFMRDLIFHVNILVAYLAGFDILNFVSIHI